MSEFKTACVYIDRSNQTNSEICEVVQEPQTQINPNQSEKGYKTIENNIDN